MDIGQYRAGVRRRAATYAVQATRDLGGEARDRARAAARNLTLFFPGGRVHAVIRAAAEGGPSPLTASASCRFSSFLSPGTSLTSGPRQVSHRFVRDVSHRSVIFLSAGRGGPR